MKTAVVVCPGRGTYNKDELGYLGRHMNDRDLLGRFDAVRTANGQPTLSELDGAERFSASTHPRGDNASGLIYAATLGDFLAIDRDKIEIVAVTGNSMGWYSTLACAGALSPEGGFEVANRMGTLMHEASIGGQLVYPFLGDDWSPDMKKHDQLLEVVAEIDARPDHDLALSIDLGGMLILAGNAAGLDAFTTAVPPVQNRYPLRLANHAAFHTALQAPVSERGRELIDRALFGQPRLPMIDGRGAIWWPGATDAGDLWDYTLGHQVTETYDFTGAVHIAAREFAPDLFIATGPGNTLGGAIAQSLVLAGWRGMENKADFQARQQSDPLLVSMGLDAQRASVT